VLLVGLRDFFTKFLVRTTKNVGNHWAYSLRSSYLIAVQCLQYCQQRHNGRPPLNINNWTRWKKTNSWIPTEKGTTYVHCIIYSKPLAATQIHGTMLLKNIPILDFERWNNVYYICPADYAVWISYFCYLSF